MFLVVTGEHALVKDSKGTDSAVAAQIQRKPESESNTCYSHFNKLPFPSLINRGRVAGLKICAVASEVSTQDENKPETLLSKSFLSLKCDT